MNHHILDLPMRISAAIMVGLLLIEPASAAPPALPDDFAFRDFTGTSEPVDVFTLVDLPFEMIVNYSDGDGRAFFMKGRDALHGVGHAGLPVKIEKNLSGDGKRVGITDVLVSYREATKELIKLKGGMSFLRGEGAARRPVEENEFRIYWQPAPIACYRDGVLLGIWDPDQNQLREATENEAPKKVAQAVRTISRDWTDTQGRTIKGTVLGYNEKAATVKFAREDGKEFELDVRKLTASDRQFVKRYVEKRRAFVESIRAFFKE